MLKMETETGEISNDLGHCRHEEGEGRLCDMENLWTRCNMAILNIGSYNAIFQCLGDPSGQNMVT